MPAATRPGRLSVATACAAGCLLTALSSAALDPRRALTQYGHDVFTQGLPQVSVQALAQTSDGYLWAGTQQGLARFNGTRFASFDTRSTPELVGNVVWALLADRAGALWIGSVPGGLTRLQDGRFTHFGPAQGLASDQVWALHEDARGVLWIGTAEGLSRAVAGRIETAPEFPRKRVRCLASDATGLWVGTESEGLWRLVPGTPPVRVSPERLPLTRIRALRVDRAGRLWVGAEGGLARVTPDGVRLFGAADGLPKDVVRALAEDRHGTLWVGTFGGGLCRVQSDDRLSCLDSRERLSSDLLLALLEDREGSLWMGTIGGGLNRLRDSPLITYTKRQGLPSDLARGVLQARDGALWIATNAGLVRREGAAWRVLTRADGLPDDDAFALAEDQAGTLWVGTRRGLARFDGRAFQAYGAREGLADDLVRAIHADRAGTLWIGTDHGLSRRQGAGFATLADVPALQARPVLSISSDRAGTLWVGTNGGGLLGLRDGRLGTHLTERDGLPSGIVRCAYEDGDGVLWICTDGGLALRRDGRVVALRERDGLLTDVVFALVDSGDGDLWLSSPRGLQRARRADLLARAAGASAPLRARVFGTADGMQSSECNGDFQPAAWRATDGRLWFPTVRGLVTVEPAQVRGQEPAPPLVIEEARADNERLPLVGGGRLRPGTRRVAFSFAALTFLDPDRARLRYRLEGFDDDAWIEAGEGREASYTNLPPGAYVFRVQAAGGPREWDEPGAALAFEMPRQVHQTWWFYVLVATGLVGAGAGAHRLRVRRLEQREVELQRLVAERTAELAERNDDLRRLATQDGLTEIANHRRFKEVLGQEWRRARRYGEPLSLLLVDVDRFKQYNDTYGHPAGDECLRRVAAALRETVRRPFDFVARYGGEEFAVLLPETDLLGARAVAERLRGDVQALGIEHGASDVGPSVTISAGVAMARGGVGASPEELLGAADAALYRAKHAGRNRVECADGL